MKATQRVAKLRQKAWALLEAGEIDLALGTFDQMIEAEPDSTAGRIQKGVAFFRLKRFEDALAVFEEVAERAPGHLTALTNQAKTLIELGRERDAMAVYKGILKAAPDHVGTWLNCGLLMFRLEKLDKALGIFKEALRLDPKHPDAWYHVGRVHWRQDSPDEALRAFSQGRRYRPEFYDLLRDEGRILREQGQLEQAASSFTKALKVKRESTEVELQLAETWLAQGDAKRAEQRFEVLMDRDQDCADAWDGRGRALVALGETARGAVHRGTAEMIRGDLEAALARFDQAIEEDPSHGAVWSNRGVVLNRMERYADALTSYQKALDLQPDAVVIMENIGTLLYRQLGREEDGVGYFQMALRYQPQRWFELPTDIQKAVDDAGGY